MLTKNVRATIQASSGMNLSTPLLSIVKERAVMNDGKGEPFAIYLI